jgi:hypothetical protein
MLRLKQKLTGIKNVHVRLAVLHLYLGTALQE